MNSFPCCKNGGPRSRGGQGDLNSDTEYLGWFTPNLNRRLMDAKPLEVAVLPRSGLSVEALQAFGSVLCAHGFGLSGSC